jgi:hypothetical protein
LSDECHKMKREFQRVCDGAKCLSTKNERENGSRYVFQDAIWLCIYLYVSAGLDAVRKWPWDGIM